MAGRPCVVTCNWCFDRADPLGVATQPLVSRLDRRAGRVEIERATCGDRARLVSR